MKITLKDGSVREYDKEMSIYEIACDISEGLGRVACVGAVDGKVSDLRTVISKDCNLTIYTFDDEEGKKAYRHTAAHILAEAVKRLRKDAKCTIGPSIENGFYYDFDTEPFSREELDALEEEMKKIIKEGHEITRFTLPRAEAIKLMEEKDEPYKVELINDLPEDAELSFYDQVGFVDLCAGPHLMSTKYVKAIKLISSSGAYWRGSEKNKMLTRIYGTAFTKKADLEAYLAHLEDIKKRDHNKLGRELEIFTTVDVIGQGLPLFMPNGLKMLNKLKRWIEDEEDKNRGYVRTLTPLMAKSDLYKISGHWDHYRDGMFIMGDPTKQNNNEAVSLRPMSAASDGNWEYGKKNDDKDLLALRPMTCPFQYFIYKSSQKSYRDLPMRMAETSTLFRNEDSGEMHGLTRVRQFTISEAHILVRPDQIHQEFLGALDLIMYVLKTLGLDEDVTYRLSKWDPNNREKYLGDNEYWESTQGYIRDILVEKGLKFEEADGEAAFYGPKLDIQTKNVYGKEDTMMTIQLDNAIAEKFDMYYIDEDGTKKRPTVIHRTSIGCYERTLAWLIEKYAGQFPTWLCPEQVRVLPISDKYAEYADKVLQELKKNDIDATVDHRSEKIGFKIRDARLKRVPYILVVGEKEQEAGTVAVRSRYLGDEGPKPLDTFINDICKEIRTKEIRKIEVTEEK